MPFKRKQKSLAELKAEAEFYRRKAEAIEEKRKAKKELFQAKHGKKIAKVKPKLQRFRSALDAAAARW